MESDKGSDLGKLKIILEDAQLKNKISSQFNCQCSINQFSTNHLSNKCKVATSQICEEEKMQRFIPLVVRKITKGQ